MAPPSRSAPAQPGLLTELFEFSRNVAAVPYEDLVATYRDAGWLTRLVETGMQATPGGGVLVSFDVLVGKDPEKLMRLDTVTMSMNPGAGPLSMIARVAAQSSMIYLVSGRLPPELIRQAAQAQEQINGQVNGHQASAPAARGIEIPDADVELPGEDKPLNLVQRYEPDGLPILRDLYEIGQPEVQSTRDIIEALLDLVDAFAAKASSVEQLNALAAKNPDLITFIKDFGSGEDAQQLSGIIADRRAALLSTGTPRRRSAAAPH